MKKELYLTNLLTRPAVAHKLWHGAFSVFGLAKKLIKLSLLCMVLIIGRQQQAQAQCNAPTAAATTTIPSTCLANGSVTVGTVTGGSGTYEYTLYDAANTTQIKPYQSSPVLSSLSSGTYKLRVHSVCTSPPFSTEFTKSVTVGGNYAQPTLTVTMTRAAQCNNGLITGSTEGSSGPYTYALVPAINTPEPVTTYVRPQQSTGVFDGLGAGTYYMRKYDACGSAVTQAVTVTSYTQANPFSASAPYLTYLPCDSFIYNFGNANFGPAFAGTTDSVKRFWVVHPNGTVDTFIFRTIPPNGFGTTNIIFPISKLGTIGAGNFPDNVGGTWPKTYQLGFKDACGNIFTYNATLHKPVITWALSATATNTGGCGTVSYNMSAALQFPIFGGDFQFIKFRSMLMTVTVNGGAPFSIHTASNPSTQLDQLDSTFLLAYSTSNTICVTYCGQTVCTTTAVPAKPAWTNFTAFEDNRYACEGNSGIRVNLGPTNTIYPVTVQMLTAPTGQTLVPSFTFNNFTEQSFSNGFQKGYIAGNLLPGTYTIRYTDGCGSSQDKTVTLAHPKEPIQSVNYYYPCSGTVPVFSFGARLWGVSIAGGNSTSPAYYSDGSAAGIFDGIFLNPDNTPATTFFQFNNTLADITNPGPNDYSASPTEFSSLTNGNTYKLRIYNTYSNGPMDRDYLTSCWTKDFTFVKTANTIDLSNSVAVACSPGTTGSIAVVAQGGGGYNYSLYQNSVSAGNLVAGPQASNIFNNLTAGTNYVISVFDSCGRSTQRSMSFGSTSSLSMLYSDVTSPCPGENFTFSAAQIPNATYQWYKNSVSIPSAVANNYTLTNLQQSDSGTYKVDVSLGTCQVSASSFILDPSACGTPLLVGLESFDVKLVDKTSVLSWATATEHESKGFAIERSIDGINWNSIGFVASLAKDGNSTLPLNYTYTDEHPFSGVSYYRLRQTDNEGKYEYSQIKSAMFESPLGALITLSPNPARNSVTLQGLHGNEQIHIYTMTGQLIKIVMATSGNETINLSDMSNGVYQVAVTNAANTVLKKLVKLN